MLERRSTLEILWIRHHFMKFATEDIPKIAALLIHATDNLNIECPSGDAVPSHPLTPLAKSCRYGHEAIVKVLLTSGANIDYQDSEAGWTALMEAIFLS